LRLPEFELGFIIFTSYTSGKCREQRNIGTLLPDTKPTLEQLNQQLLAAEGAGDPSKQGIALNNLANHYKESRDTAKAAEYFLKALDFFSVLQDMERKATVLNNLGGTYHDAGQYQKALEYFALALGTYGSLGQAFGQGMAVNNLGGVHLVLKRYGDAQSHFRLAATFFHNAGASSWEAQALENLAATEVALGNTKAAVESYGRALQLWQNENHPERQAMILNRIASLHSSSGESRRAIDLHGRALALARQAGNLPVEAGTHTAIGRIYLELKDWKTAQANFEAAAKICEQCSDTKGRGFALLELGKLNLAVGSELIQSAAALFKEIGDVAGERAALELIEAQSMPNAKNP
jgi:tetratricopeptide (TPR) repeat protein